MKLANILCIKKYFVDLQQVAKWQQKYRVDWDATDGRNGGAQQRRGKS